MQASKPAQPNYPTASWPYCWKGFLMPNMTSEIITAYAPLWTWRTDHSLLLHSSLSPIWRSSAIPTLSSPPYAKQSPFVQSSCVGYDWYRHSFLLTTSSISPMAHISFTWLCQVTETLFQQSPTAVEGTEALLQEAGVYTPQHDVHCFHNVLTSTLQPA